MSIKLTLKLNNRFTLNLKTPKTLWKISRNFKYVEKNKKQNETAKKQAEKSNVSHIESNSRLLCNRG